MLFRSRPGWKKPFFERVSGDPESPNAWGGASYIVPSKIEFALTGGLIY